MGADLYIQSNYERLQALYGDAFGEALQQHAMASTGAAIAEAKRKVAEVEAAMLPPEAYFRDPYNRWCLIAQLGLSWTSDVLPKLHDTQWLRLKDVRWLLDEVRSRRFTCQNELNTEQQLTAQTHASMPGTTFDGALFEGYSASDVQEFVSRKKDLITFLETALELGEEPIFSL